MFSNDVSSDKKIVKKYDSTEKYILVKYRKKLKDCQSKSSKWAFEDTEFSDGRDVSEWP